MMTVNKSEISKVLDSLLNKKAIQKLMSTGEIPKLPLGGHPSDFKRFSAEVTIYIGHRVEKALKRDLFKKEFNSIADKVMWFLRESYKS